MSASPGRPPRGAGAPGAALLLTDYGRAAGEFGSLFYSWPLLAAVPCGDGRPVLVLPGPTAKAVTGLRGRLNHLSDEHATTVTLTGWSLGGIYARQLARRTPTSVRQVITLGSPIRLAILSPH